MSAFSRADWERLRELRAGFLAAESRAEPAASADYFRCARDVELYDATFARRIEWKWRAALREVELRAPELAPRSVLDWACGSGAAVRALLESPVGARVERVTLFERSRLAREHARGTLLALRPGLDVRIATSQAECEAELAVASHVLDELDARAEAELEASLRHCASAIVLESGARASSRLLGRLRSRLVDEFEVLAPCTHRAECGALADVTNWCHFFARPPGEVFQDALWSEFARELSVDLRSLAYSFLALSRTPRPLGRDLGSDRGPDLARILGRPRLLKGRALLDACSSWGLATLSLLEREDRRLFKSLEQASNEPRLWRFERDGARIRAPREALTSRDSLADGGAELR